MIRGACILAVGFALGYAKAMSEVPEVKEVLEALKKEWARTQAGTAKTETDTNTDDSIIKGEICP